MKPVAQKVYYVGDKKMLLRVVLEDDDTVGISHIAQPFKKR